MVIVASRYTELEEFLKHKKENYFYIQVGRYPGGMDKFFEGKECKKIDIREGLDGIDFKREYIDFIGKLNYSYNSAYWWSNSISYKGTFVSNLYQELYDYYCIISLIKQKKHNYIIISSDLILNDHLRGYCRKNDIEFKLFGTDKKRDRIVHFRRCCLSAAYFLYNGWMRKILVSIYLSKNIAKAIKGSEPYYVIKSWIDHRSFHENKYVDIFFGQLPGYLKTKGKRFIILGGILNDYKSIILRLKKIKEAPLVPQEYFIGYFDFIKVIWLNFINKQKIKYPVKFIGLDVTDFIEEFLRKDYEQGEVNKNFVYYYYIKGLLKKIKVKSFIFTFENQAWERMSILAMRRYSPLTSIVGYAHASIAQSYLPYFYSKAEENVIPLPDRILTTGMEPRMILSSSGIYKSRVNLLDGCALRYEYLFEKERIRRNKDGSILVAFSIHMDYSLKLLSFIYDSLREVPNVILRPHPLTPVQSMIKKLDMRLGENFIVSENQRLEQDLNGAALVIYVDSAASIEALMCGVPAVNIDFKDPVSPDPLFKLNSFKWKVSEKDELRDVIHHIYGLSDEEYSKEYNDAMRYLKNYFYPVEEKYLKEFIV